MKRVKVKRRGRGRGPRWGERKNVISNLNSAPVVSVYTTDADRAVPRPREGVKQPGQCHAYMGG